ncbi:hypothetical protein D7V80_11485 [Corallococcus sp. CA054B]|uniref:hypothetical protein n=1 Tax=Corallococcus sp. CA054B TaxID=2316734 RepID=UPI000EA0F49B|nr:hypothetical protein [Corallococcus sp. CA054B]RKG68759.1 hypothetical protein D7V80_11485 [Corallococcus sp. CA054B]
MEPDQSKTPQAGIPVSSAGAASAASVSAAGNAAQHNVSAQVANDFLRQGEAAIDLLGRQYVNATDAQLAGRVAEEFHVATFNAEAALQGRLELQAHTTVSVGRPHDAVDVEVLKHGVKMADAQVKYLGTAERTAKGLSHPGYEGQAKIGPADQLDGIRETARREAARNAGKRPAQAKHYEDTAGKASDRLQYETVRSKPLTKKNAVKLARRARKGHSGLGRVPQQNVARHVGQAAGRGAVAGGAVAGALTAVFSGVSNGIDAFKGRKGGREAVVDTAKDAGVAAMDGAAKGAVGAGVQAGAAVLARSAASQVLKKAAGTLVRSNAALAVGTVAVDAVVGGVQLARGKIDGGEYAQRVGESAAGATGAVAGMKAGALVGMAVGGPPGALVGGVVAGTAAALGAGQLIRWGFRKRKRKPEAEEDAAPPPAETDPAG